MSNHVQAPNLTDDDMSHLRRCVDLARAALEAGDEPFGSVLVSGEGRVLREDRNRAHSKNPTYHPEIAVARWAAENMSESDRKDAVVFTSGEHCAMCSAAHAWAGLGRIVYISSMAQLDEWAKEFGATSGSPINSLAINDVAPNIPVEGPVEALMAEVKALQKQALLKPHAK